jgi:tetratricopeptide (TPR) repeat protein
MMRSVCLSGILLAAAACAETAQDRLHEITTEGARLYKTGAYDHARAQFEAALKLKPDDADLTYNLARCHEKLGDRAQAEQLYQACLKRDPNHDEAHQAWLELMVDGGRTEEGQRMVRTWLRSQPNQPGPYIADGWLCARAGDRPSARVRFQRALDLDPRNVRAMVELAGIFERLGDGRVERALVLYQRALDIKPDQDDLRKKVAELRARRTGQPHPD